MEICRNQWKRYLVITFESLSSLRSLKPVLHKKLSELKLFKVNYIFFCCSRKVTESILQETKDLPEEFDWRDKDGDDFVSPVRNQGNCGSCYAFASMGQLESGVRIKSNGRIQVVFSPQDVVSCSEYSQGCDGGRFVHEALPNHFLARISDFF